MISMYVVGGMVEAQQELTSSGQSNGGPDFMSLSRGNQLRRLGLRYKIKRPVFIELCRLFGDHPREELLRLASESDMKARYVVAPDVQARLHQVTGETAVDVERAMKPILQDIEKYYIDVAASLAELKK